MLTRQELLPYLIRHEHFITCPLLLTDNFVSMCKTRGLDASRKLLEQLEQLGIFYPLMRIRYPKMTVKIEHVEGGKDYRYLGRLEDGEEWTGPTIQKYSDFRLNQEFAQSWFDEHLLWDPQSRPFEPWSSFKDHEGHYHTDSFYSIFQWYTLHTLLRATSISLGAEWLCAYTEEQMQRVVTQTKKWADGLIPRIRESGVRGEAAVQVCQLISNRYYPQSQTDQRSIVISTFSHYNNWDWFDYCSTWNARSVLTDLHMTVEDVAHFCTLVDGDAEYLDPLSSWRDLVDFVSVDRRKHLKGDALLAQTLYSMVRMLRLFQADLEGKAEVSVAMKDRKPKDLEYIVNAYHLNPRPRLILVVEGDGEERELPRLAKELFGCEFPTLGIEVINIRGVGNFGGSKMSDKYGAFEKFIDYHHHRQTVVFIVLDREGPAEKTKERLVARDSTLSARRKVTKSDHIHLWDPTIEFANFSDDEIAVAMTSLCANRYMFTASEIAQCRSDVGSRKADPLSALYLQRLTADLDKPALLAQLFNVVIAGGRAEFDEKGEGRRDVVRVMKSVIHLASTNHPPVDRELWERNQESGFLADRRP